VQERLEVIGEELIIHLQATKAMRKLAIKKEKINHHILAMLSKNSKETGTPKLWCGRGTGERQHLNCGALPSYALFVCTCTAPPFTCSPFFSIFVAPDLPAPPPAPRLPGVDSASPLAPPCSHKTCLSMQSRCATRKSLSCLNKYLGRDGGSCVAV
jgi:hypothetical protein